MAENKRKQQGGQPRRTTCKTCGCDIDNSDMSKKAMPRCRDCQLEFVRETRNKRRDSGPKRVVDWTKTRRTTCKVCGASIDNSNLSKPAYTECTKCTSKRVATSRHNKVFGERKLNIEQMNAELLSTGSRICSKCFSKKSLEEFSNSVGKRATAGGKIHKLCDVCLDKYYSSNLRPDSFTHTYLRKRAYSINCRSKKKLESFTGRSVAEIDALPSVVKPQDLTQLLESVSYKCYYCGDGLTTEVTTFDHLKPLGTADSESEFAVLIKSSNLVACCKDCNHLKHTRTEEEFNTFKVEYAKRILALEQ